MEYSKKAISLDDTLPEPHSNLSHIYLLKRRYDESIAEAEKAIDLQPSFFVGYYILSWAFIFSGKPQMAQQMIKQAIRLNPKQPVNKFGLGVTYYLLEQYEESIVLFKTTLQQIPDFPNIHIYLIASYIMAGMEDEARKQVDVIIQLDPKFSVDSFAERLPYKNQEDTDRILNALRKAGLK